MPQSRRSGITKGKERYVRAGQNNSPEVPHTSIFYNFVVGMRYYSSIVLCYWILVRGGTSSERLCQVGIRYVSWNQDWVQVGFTQYGLDWLLWWNRPKPKRWIGQHSSAISHHKDGTHRLTILDIRIFALNRVGFSYLLPDVCVSGLRSTPNLGSGKYYHRCYYT